MTTRSILLALSFAGPSAAGSSLSAEEVGRLIVAAARQNVEHFPAGHAVYRIEKRGDPLIAQNPPFRFTGTAEVWWQGDSARLQWDGRRVTRRDQGDQTMLSRLDVLILPRTVLVHQPLHTSLRGHLTIARTIDECDGIAVLDEVDVRPGNWWLRSGLPTSYTFQNQFASLTEPKPATDLVRWEVVQAVGSDGIDLVGAHQLGSREASTRWRVSLSQGGLLRRMRAEGWHPTRDYREEHDRTWVRAGAGYALQEHRWVERQGRGRPFRQETCRMETFEDLSAADADRMFDRQAFMGKVRRMAEIDDRIAGRRYRHLEDTEVGEDQLRLLAERLREGS